MSVDCRRLLEDVSSWGLLDAPPARPAFKRAFSGYQRRNGRNGANGRISATFSSWSRTPTEHILQLTAEVHPRYLCKQPHHKQTTYELQASIPRIMQATRANGVSLSQARKRTIARQLNPFRTLVSADAHKYRAAAEDCSVLLRLSEYRSEDA